MCNALLSVTLVFLCAPPVETAATPTTHLYVRTTPPGAKVLLDGKPLGTSPGVFSVEPGVRRTVIDLDGYERDDKEITIRAGRVTRLELKLRSRVSGESAPESAGEMHRQPISGVRILDAETRRPVCGCSLTFAGWGQVVYTDKNGICRGEGTDFLRRLAGADTLQICHPDYRSQSCKVAYLDPADGLVTHYLRKEGNASLTVDVSLTVRGRKTDAPCRVGLREGHQERTGPEVRHLDRSDDHLYRFGGLAPGDYTIEASFWDSYPTHYEVVQLADRENRILHVDAKTEQIARIRVEGVVLDKRTGEPVEGLSLHFCGAPADNVLTDKNGRFSAVGDRARFPQTYLLRGGSIVFWAEMDSRMPESLAQRLEFHVDPDNERLRVSDEDQDGVFCDGRDCAVCAGRRNAGE